MHLLTLVSRQLWTQVLVFLHLNPESVLLLHTDSKKESLEPSRRLETLLASPPSTVRGVPARLPALAGLEPVPDGHDLQALVDALDHIVARRNLDPRSLVLNATGGQRLMTAAATEWARLRGVPLVFLDRNRDVTRLQFHDNRWHPRQESARVDAVQDWDPNVLLELNSGQTLAKPGQWLALTNEGRSIDAARAAAQLRVPDEGVLRRLLRRLDSPDPVHFDGKQGTPWELNAAFWVLRCGIPSVRHGVAVHVPEDERGVKDEELDLLFTHHGRQWLVEVKHRKSSGQSLQRIYSWLEQSQAPQDVLRNWGMLKSELEETGFRSLKLDLLAARRFGGMHTEVIRVSKDPLSEDILQFARAMNIHCLVAGDLPRELAPILNPELKASNPGPQPAPPPTAPDPGAKPHDSSRYHIR